MTKRNELNWIYCAIWCQIVSMRLNGADTKQIEWLMGELEKNLDFGGEN